MEFIIIKKVTLKDVMKHYLKKVFSKNVLLKLVAALLIIILIMKYFARTPTPHEIRLIWTIQTDAILIKLMSDKSSTMPKISNFIHPNHNFYHFYRTPKKMKNMFYSEMTSANPDTAHPLAPDFSFHISYHKNRVKIFQDTNCGCIYRIYILPPFTSYANEIDTLNPQNLKNLFLEITLDDVTKTYSLTQMLEGIETPFLSPISPRNLRPISGVGSYSPFCYGKNAVIHYVDDNEYPGNLLNMTVECVSNELKCPIKQYTAVSYLKSASNPGLNMKWLNEENRANLPYLAKYMESPEFYGPHSDQGCNFICEPFDLKDKKIKLLHKKNASGVIVSILLTSINKVRDGMNTFESDERRFKIWNDIFLTVYTDGLKYPKVKVSLGSLFVVQGSTNDFVSSAYGRSKRYCNYLVNSTQHSSSSSVGYFYLPIPYWHNVKMELEYRGGNIPTSQLMCYQVLETDNFYDENETGHLYGQIIFHSGQTDRWREVLTVKGGWGHLVSLGVEINNLKPKLDGSLIERWAALQADPVIYVDNSKSPRVRGTGLEDYFSFSHGFAGAENRSFSFVGVPYGYEDKSAPKKSWSCYRHHILDPILFDEALEFIMEGTDDDVFFEPAKKLTFEEYKSLASSGSTSFAYTTFYYFKNVPKSFDRKVCDEIVFCNNRSLVSHHYVSKNNRPTIFKFDSLRYLGDSKYNTLEKDVCGFAYKNNSAMQFLLKVPTNLESKFVLTRKYHSNLFQWNDRCLLECNGWSLEWLFAIGPTNNEYSLREESIILPITSSLITENSFRFDLTILSEWRDISYTLCSILE